ncbi:hypothetical protein [Nostocoides sp. F2B08]|nr:hypothetical protein [Tetrasphaera sp. F2B08]
MQANDRSYGYMWWITDDADAPGSPHVHQGSPGTTDKTRRIPHLAD